MRILFISHFLFEKEAKYVSVFSSDVTLGLELCIWGSRHFFFFFTKGSPDDFTGCYTNSGFMTVQRQVGEDGVIRHSWGTGGPHAGQLWLEASRSLHVASKCPSVRGAGVTTWKT